MAGGPTPNIGRIVPKETTGQHKRFRPVNKSLGGPKEHQEFKAYEDDHPLVRLFHNPNQPDVAYDLWAYHILFKKLMGSSHWWVIKNGLGTPVELWVIPTHWMRMHTDSDGMPLAYSVQPPWGATQVIPYKDVVSFYEHSPLNRYEGYAVSQAIAEWIDVYEATMRTWLATFKNGATPSFHVELDESYGDPDEAFLARYYNKWFSRFQGEEKSGQPLITGPGVKVNPLGIAPKDVGFETTEERIATNTCIAYETPKSIVGIQEGMTYGSVQAVYENFYMSAVNPELVYTGQVLTEKVIKPVDKEGAIFWDERHAEDMERLDRELDQDLRNGTITHNEYRTVRSREPYKYGGDNPVVQGVPMPWAVQEDKASISSDLDLDLELQQQLTGAGHGSQGLPGGDLAPEEAGAEGASAEQADANAAALKSTVGGSAQIMDMQKAVHAEEMTIEMARANVEIIFGISPEQAIRLFPDPRDARRPRIPQQDRTLSSGSGTGGGFIENGNGAHA